MRIQRRLIWAGCKAMGVCLMLALIRLSRLGAFRGYFHLLTLHQALTKPSLGKMTVFHIMPEIGG